jgi:hypothetical protein
METRMIGEQICSVIPKSDDFVLKIKIKLARRGISFAAMP